MQSAALPDNDSKRLDTLRSLNILDSRPEERFDRLTRLAMQWHTPVTDTAALPLTRMFYTD